jgi:predicted methyltransferase
MREEPIINVGLLVQCRGDKMRRIAVKRFLIVLTSVWLAACAASTGTSTGTSSSGALDSDFRSAEDRARDAGRKPAEVLEFLGVTEGSTVLDVMAAGGYYTEVLSLTVGESGRVYAQNPATMLRFRSGANDRALNARLFNNRLPNVRRLDRGFEDLGLTESSIDVAITALNFHDIYNNSPEAADAMLKAIKHVLKPGGVFGIIDHAGKPGADNARIHRIEKAKVVSAAEQAGFEIGGDSDLLANPDDDGTQMVFAPGLRGNTDRLLLKLVKPAA